MFGDAQFAAMKSSAFFINTGRGPTANEDALIRALSEHQIAGAGLDVFDLEPLPPGHALTRLDNVTAHAAHGRRYTAGRDPGLAGWTDTFVRLRENIRRVEAGEPVLSPMRPSDPQPGA